MKNKIIFGLVAGVFIASTQTAFAADKSWTGLKVGVGIGGLANEAKQKSNGSSSYAYTDSSDSSDSFYSAVNSQVNGHKDFGENSLFGTLDAVFDYQVNDKFVLGLTANYDFSNGNKATSSISGSTSVDTSQDAPFTGYNGSSQTEMMSSFSTKDAAAVGLRFGFLATDSTLLYLSGGWATTKVKSSYSYRTSENQDIFDYNENDNFASSSFTNQTSRNRWENGYYVGAGVESKLTSNISLKVEYRFSDYGKIKQSAAADSGMLTADSLFLGTDTPSNLSSSSMRNEIDLQQHAVRAVISYNF